MNHWERVARGQRSDLRSTAHEQGTRADQERVDPLLRDTRERRSDLPIAVGGKDLDRPPDGHRRRLRVHCHRCDSMLIVGIDERSKAPRLWQELVQEPDPLRGELRIGKADACDVATRWGILRYCVQSCAEWPPHRLWAAHSSRAGGCFSWRPWPAPVVDTRA
jgi:hypothetical protein